MSVIKFVDPKLETITINVKLDIATVALINKFILVNQHNRNTHGPMNLDKLVAMLLEDVADFMKGDAAGWRGGHMSIVLGEHGYHSSNI